MTVIHISMRNQGFRVGGFSICCYNLYISKIDPEYPGLKLSTLFNEKILFIHDRNSPWHCNPNTVINP